MPEQFTTDRLVISRLRGEDAEEIFYSYASKPVATRFVSWPTHQRIQDTRQFLAYTRSAWQAGVDFSYGIRLKNHRFIGSCGVINDLGKIQFGYVLSPTHWRQGYATEACSMLMRLLRATPGVHTVGTFIDAENIASERVLLKSGLMVVDRKPKWFAFVNQGNILKDCVLFGLPLTGYQR